MEEVILTKSTEETQKLAENLSQKIRKGGIVLLYGNLGAGKTTFVQGLAKGFGITKRIISPTFIILRQYEISSIKYPVSNISAKGGWTSGPKSLYHIDLYRLGNEKEIEGLGLIELINNPENIIVIEWPEKLGKLLQKKRWEIKFNVVNENQREITIQQF